VGKYSNLADYSWYDRVESIRFEGSYVNNYHVVLYSEKDFSGDPALRCRCRGSRHCQQNHVRSLEIYKKYPAAHSALRRRELQRDSEFIPVGKTADLSSVAFGTGPRASGSWAIAPAASPRRSVLGKGLSR